MLAYRLTQAENALVMSLAAIPVYLLSRRLGLGAGLALVAAALTVASPDLFFASFVLADPLAYLLVLTTLYAAVCALSRPSRRAQTAFVVLAALTALTRIQYALLPIVFLAGALAVERGSIRRALRNFRLTWGIFVAPLAALIVVGPSRVLGYYNSVVSLHVRPGSIVHWVATDSMLLVYCAGWVLIPGALIGFAYALGRPRSREEAAFGGVTAGLLVMLFAETSMYASNGSPRFQERYFMGLLPLVLPWFGLYLKRGRPARLATLLLAVVLLAVSARIPLAPYSVATNKQDSPFLLGAFRLEHALGLANGSLAIAAVAALLSGLAAGIVWRARFATLALAVSLGLDLLLGGFVAGLITRMALHDREVSVFESKLAAVGYGFLIPFFFITSGMNFDLDALLSSASALLKLPLFFALFLLVRGAPALLLYRRVLDARDRVALGIYSATALPLVVAITTIAQKTSEMAP